MKKYYALETSEKEADITIFGDITSFPWTESDVSAYNLSKQIADLDVDTINVHINSYGGEVSEGLAIYNSLLRHKAQIKTYSDGFSCSIASVIFMAGAERIMSNSSMLMVHNPWMYTSGNATQLRKDAADLDKMAQASVNAYMLHATITEEELKKLLEAETWILPEEALEYGLATSITGVEPQAKYSQSVRKCVMQRLSEKAIPKQQASPETEPKPEQKKEPENQIMNFFKNWR